MSEWSSRVIAVEFFQEMPSWCWNEQACQGRKSVNRSNGLGTVLYILYCLSSRYLGDVGELRRMAGRCHRSDEGRQDAGCQQPDLSERSVTVCTRRTYQSL